MPRSLPRDIVGGGDQYDAHASVSQVGYEAKKAEREGGRTPTDAAGESSATTLCHGNVLNTQSPAHASQLSQRELNRNLQSMQLGNSLVIGDFARADEGASDYDDDDDDDNDALAHADPSRQPQHEALRGKVFDQAKALPGSIAGATATTVSSSSRQSGTHSSDHSLLLPLTACIEYRIYHSRFFEFGRVRLGPGLCETCLHAAGHQIRMVPASWPPHR